MWRGWWNAAPAGAVGSMDSSMNSWLAPSTGGTPSTRSASGLRPEVWPSTVQECRGEANCKVRDRSSAAGLCGDQLALASSEVTFAALTERQFGPSDSLYPPSTQRNTMSRSWELASSLVGCEASGTDVALPFEPRQPDPTR